MAVGAVDIAACLAVAGILAIGQILFKRAADDLSARGGFTLDALASSPWLVAAVAFYALATLLWVWVLMRVPLSRAYPFVLLAAPLVPLWSWWHLGESLGLRYVAGALLVVAGLALIQSR